MLVWVLKWWMIVASTSLCDLLPWKREREEAYQLVEETVSVGYRSTRLRASKPPPLPLPQCLNEHIVSYERAQHCKYCSYCTCCALARGTVGKLSVSAASLASYIVRLSA